MLVSEALSLYIGDVVAFKNLSPATERSYINALDSFIASAGDIDTMDITFTHIRQWRAQMLTKRRSEGTITLYITNLRTLVRYLYKQRLTSLDPDAIPLPKARSKPPHYLTPEQVATCIAKTRRIKNKAIVALLYGSMLRVSELCSMNRGQIHDRRFTVVGKGGKARVCFIDERTETLVNLYLATRTDDKIALFLTDKGERIKPITIRDTFKSIRMQTGFTCHPHTMRHSGATDLMQGGMHIYSLSRLMGHSSIQSTQVYLHTSDPILQDDFNKFRTI